jgi:hypothetical protein
MRNKTISIMVAVLCLPTIVHAKAAVAGYAHRFIAPEHMQRSRQYGISKPSTTAQANGDIAADRVDARRQGAAAGLPGDEPTKPVLDNGDGWAYSILIIRRWASGYSYVHPTTYGVYDNEDACKLARTKKIADMETNPTNVDGLQNNLIQEWRSLSDEHGKLMGVLQRIVPQDCKPYTDQKLTLGTTVNQH